MRDGSIPLVELEWLGDVGENDTEGRATWMEKVRECVGVLQKGLEFYFRYVIIPIITSKPAGGTLSVVVDTESVVAMLLEVKDHALGSWAGLKLKFTVTYSGTEYVFDAKPSDNTISKIAEYAMHPPGGAAATEFLQQLQAFFGSVSGDVMEDEEKETKKKVLIFSR